MPSKPSTPADAPSRPTVREAFVRLMRDLGLDTVFGNPGSTELPMFRDFPKDFRYVLGLQESIVVGMADGYAQATRRAALVNLHSAAGVGHAMGNLFTAFKNQTPLIVTAGQQSRSILPFDPFLAAAQATDLPRPYVKWACEPARAEDVPLALLRAYHVAMQPPCGPVFLSIPADDWDRSSDWVPVRQVSHATAPAPQAIARVAEALAESRRPVIVVGAGVDRDDAVDRVVQLAERHEAAVVVAPMSARCGFPERHRLFQGFLPAMREAIVDKLAPHDLILVLGAPAFSYHVEGSGPHIPVHARLFQVVDDPQVAAWTPCGDSVVASIGLAVDALLEGPGPRVQRVPPEQRPAMAPAPASDPMSAAFALQTLDAVRRPGDVVVEEAPGSRGTMQRCLPMDGAQSFYTMASGGLGHGMPAAVGVALARQRQQQPGRVICLIGDGSSLYSIQALYSAVQWKVPMSFVILNNQRYAALQDFAPVFGYGPEDKPAGTDLPGLDFVALAQGHGLAGPPGERAEELGPALRAAFEDDGPNLVEIVIS